MTTACVQAGCASGPSAVLAAACLAMCFGAAGEVAAASPGDMVTVTGALASTAASPAPLPVEAVESAEGGTPVTGPETLPLSPSQRQAAALDDPPTRAESALTPLAYGGYSSPAAAELAAHYRAPTLGSGNMNTSQRTTSSLWRDTSAPTRSVFRVGLAPTLRPAPMIGPPPAVPEVNVALSARVERFDRSFKAKSTSEQWKELGTLKLQLGNGGNNSLSLKPRKGGAFLSWQSKW